MKDLSGAVNELRLQQETDQTRRRLENRTLAV